MFRARGCTPYWARKRCTPTPWERENTKLDHIIATVFDESRRSYGRPRMQRALRARRIRIGDNRLQRKMRQMDLRVVGWAAADHMRAELVTDALDMRVGRRHVEPGLIFHSDRGGQFVSRQLRLRLARFRIRQRMSRRGNCYGDAVVESFNDKQEQGQELVHRRSWPTRKRVYLAIADYIERFRNPVRLHSTLGYLSPNDFEALHRDAENLAAYLQNRVSVLADHGQFS